MIKAIKLFKTLFVKFPKKLFGYKETSKRGSNRRRVWARTLLYITLLLFADLSLNNTSLILSCSNRTIASLAFSLLFIGLYFFIVAIILMPFRDKSDFRVNPYRLFLDTCTSGIFFIIVYSLIYKVLKIQNGGLDTHDFTDYIYFSIVTFSTLGYGDFVPSPGARIMSSTQAILGNIHLGFIVASVFAGLNNDRRMSEIPSDHNTRDN